MKLVDTKTGPIELVEIGPAMFLQFNCDCSDALPYCGAMCCRMRMVYNVALTEEESQRLGGIDLPKDGNVLKVLPIKDTVTWDCKYLSEDKKCNVQQEKPANCTNWHCSPRGNVNDEKITKRDIGFMIVPSNLRRD